MSLFADLPGPNRRTLFWLVCVLLRLLIATAFTTFVYYGPAWVAYSVGGIGIVNGIFFWVRKCTDDGPKIWWSRVAHGLIWVSGGTAAITTRYFEGASISAAAVGAFFFFDVLFGIGTVLFPSRNPWSAQPKQDSSPQQPLVSLNNRDARFVYLHGVRLFGATDNPVPAWITKWSLVHLTLSSGAGVGAFFLDRDVFEGDSLWAVCLLASFGILLWEAFENTHLDFKGKHLGNDQIDSDANLLGDILVGFAGLWGTAFILNSTVD